MHVAIERQTDAKHINAILNHPEVYPYVRGLAEGPLDLAPLLESEGVIALLGEHGGQVYAQLQPGLYECHSQFLPQGRGDYAIAATQASLKWMFARTDAVEIMTRCPHQGAKILAKNIGGTFEFTNPRGWVVDGKDVPADIYSLKIQDWMRTAPGLTEKGAWFHQRLEAELARHGQKDLVHAHDDIHDRYVGAVCEMFFGGQPVKGEIFYNRFAAFAGYGPITVLRDRNGRPIAPLALDIGTAILVLRDDDFFIPAVNASPVQH